jgi:tRNA (cytidine/uridine-2'-O-)-methyltransferase
VNAKFEEYYGRFMRLALFQPDIPQNTGAILRLAAGTGVGLDVIEPCGFVWSEPRMRRAGMDYIDLASVTRHASWQAFKESKPARIVLLTTQASMSFTNFFFEPTDTLLLGRETAGVPRDVHEEAGARLVIPMTRQARSFNVALAAAMVLGEALRQTGGFPTRQQDETADDGYGR